VSGKISLDTNIVIRLLKNDPIVTKKLASSSNFFLPVPVIAELLFAAKNSYRIKEKTIIFN
jgi:tRNA(fMet)-specific endonuclease VapC